MFTLATVVCLAHGLDVQCERHSQLYSTIEDCVITGRAYVEYISQYDPLYVTAWCLKGGLA